MTGWQELCQERVLCPLCSSVGGNNIGKVRSKQLHRKYRKSLGLICDLGGVLAGNMWCSTVLECDWQVAFSCSCNEQLAG